MIYTMHYTGKISADSITSMVFRQSYVALSVSNPGFPKPETCFFWLFSTTRNPFFFQPWNLDIFKNLELLLHLNTSNSDNTELVEWHV